MTGLFDDPDRKLKHWDYDQRERVTSRHEAFQRVAKPAKDLTATAGVQLIISCTLFSAFAITAYENFGTPLERSAALPQAYSPVRATLLATLFFGYALVDLFLLIAGMRMRQLRDYTLCRFAVIIAWIPPVSALCALYARRIRDALDHPGVEEMFQ